LILSGQASIETGQQAKIENIKVFWAVSRFVSRG